MKHYQLQVNKFLVDAGWELVSIDRDVEWWSAEEWTVVSRREGWGTKIWINFLVDPQYDGQKKESAVWAVSASLSRPKERVEAESGTLMDLVKGHFQAKLEGFVASLDELRRTSSRHIESDA